MAYVFHFKMTCQNGWLFFSILVFFCFVSSNGKGASTPFRVPLKMTNSGSPIAEITIGSASNSYKMRLGSYFSGVWVLSKKACETKKSEANTMCDKVQKYDDTQIPEEDKKKTFKAPHIDGQVEGYLIKTSVKIGELVLDNQEVGIVTKWDPEMATSNKDGQYDGYLGILSMDFFKSLDSEKIPKKRFGLYLDSANQEGELTLGGVNRGYIKFGEAYLMDIPLESGGTKGWLLNVDSIKVETKEVLGTGTSIKAYVDPSISAFAGQTSIVTDINKQLGAFDKYDKSFKFPSCDKAKGSPRVQFTFGRTIFKLNSSSNYMQIPMVCGSSFVIETSITDYNLLLGSRFLNDFYSVFDVEGKKLQLAEVFRPRKN